jgi:hypothetical protein
MLVRRSALVIAQPPISPEASAPKMINANEVENFQAS